MYFMIKSICRGGGWGGVCVLGTNDLNGDSGPGQSVVEIQCCKKVFSPFLVYSIFYYFLLFLFILFSILFFTMKCFRPSI